MHNFHLKSSFYHIEIVHEIYSVHVRFVFTHFRGFLTAQSILQYNTFCYVFCMCVGWTRCFYIIFCGLLHFSALIIRSFVDFVLCRLNICTIEAHIKTGINSHPSKQKKIPKSVSEWRECSCTLHTSHRQS